MSSSIEVVLAQISSFGTFPVGWVGWWGWEESIIRLISAEAVALLCLAELGIFGERGVGGQFGEFQI